MSAASPRGRVLVVDDVQSMCEMLAERLPPLGFEVEWRTSAADALAYLAAAEVDAVVTDINMREMDGLEDQITVADLPDKVQHHRPSYVVVAGDDPSELISLEEMERRYILRVMEAVAGNKTLAAQVLKLGRKTLYRKLEHYGAS